MKVITFVIDRTLIKAFGDELHSKQNQNCLERYLAQSSHTKGASIDGPQSYYYVIANKNFHCTE